jgi:hypothetical protein
VAIVVVGGGGRSAGKTALVCGIIAALPEFEWTAVKITRHGHGDFEPIHEETVPGQGTDTARYLGAGARRAFLLTADDGELPQRLSELKEKLGAASHVIFESNRILNHLRPDLCVAIDSGIDAAQKPSFRLVEQQMHAVVRLDERGRFERGLELPVAKPVFHLAAFECISLPMREWLRERLNVRAG